MQSLRGKELAEMLPCPKSAGMMSSTEVQPKLISHLERAEVAIESMKRLSESHQLFKRSSYPRYKFQSNQPSLERKRKRSTTLM